MQKAQQSEVLARKPYILVAPNGARRSTRDHLRLPIRTEEIVETARTCFRAGANGIHLHIRDEQGVHSLDAGRYRETISALGEACPEMDVQITTEAAGLYDVAAQLDCLRHVRPNWASIAVREIARSPELADHVYGACAEQGTRVQHILYDTQDLTRLSHWQESGTVRRGQTDRLFVLGGYTQRMTSSPEELDQFPASGTNWMVCAFGPQEHACLHLAASRGGDVRVGFENSLTDYQETPWADNAASVAALAVSLREVRT